MMSLASATGDQGREGKRGEEEKRREERFSTNVVTSLASHAQIYL
jgi:hypothetical protein